MTASELNEEVVKLRAQLKSAEDNFTRIEEENAQARELAEQLRTDVVKKQNEIIREKKEQDRLGCFWPVFVFSRLQNLFK